MLDLIAGIVGISAACSTARRCEARVEKRGKEVAEEVGDGGAVEGARNGSLSNQLIHCTKRRLRHSRPPRGPLVLCHRSAQDAREDWDDLLT